jgi:hypothetical protein
MKIETYCPLFPGFYNTRFEPSEENEIYSHNQEHDTDLNYDDFEWDYKDYKERVACAFVEDFEHCFQEIMPVKIRYQSISSPAFYNFSNDSINIEVDLDFPRFMKIVNENKENIREYILENYTSRDGFNSFHSNNVDVWCDPEYVLEFIQHRVGALMEALATHYIDEDDQTYWADSEMYINYRVKYPFSEGEHYFTIEDGDIVESVWDNISEELHRSDKQYFSSLDEAKLSPLATKSIHLL